MYQSELGVHVLKNNMLVKKMSIEFYEVFVEVLPQSRLKRYSVAIQHLSPAQNLQHSHSLVETR